MSKHTPGPWHCLYTRVDDASGYQVCHGDLHGKGEETNLANLRLIAAAPELLDALRRIAAIENQLVGPDWEEIDEARVIALMAIEKATGAIEAQPTKDASEAGGTK
jgi:hypothetical protein